MSAIHQFVAGYTHGDAISNEAVALRDVFRSWGYDSHIFSETKRILPELRKDARDVTAYRAACSPDDVVLLHLSIGSKVNDVFAALPCKKAILYHNMTPAHFFEPLHRQIAQPLIKGREQILKLVNSAQVNMAVSGFNASELEAAGYSDVRVFPIFLDLNKTGTEPDRKTMRRLDDGLVNILFVGRCVPNKRIEDLIMTFAAFQQHVEPKSRFIHIGSFSGLERYHYAVLAQSREMGLRNIMMPGAQNQAQLNACYAKAHVFLCMSEHEGFCIPLIESMLHDVPILAYEAAAIPETLGGAGVLFDTKDFGAVAEMMGQMVHNSSLRDSILTKQRARLKEYLGRDLEAELREHMAPLLSNG
jgi:glycosyltransferase involved in cell wall biosynthesis